MLLDQKIPLGVNVTWPTCWFPSILNCTKAAAWPSIGWDTFRSTLKTEIKVKKLVFSDFYVCRSAMVQYRSRSRRPKVNPDPSGSRSSFAVTLMDVFTVLRQLFSKLISFRSAFLIRIRIKEIQIMADLCGPDSKTVRNTERKLRIGADRWKLNTHSTEKRKIA